MLGYHGHTRRNHSKNGHQPGAGSGAVRGCQCAVLYRAGDQDDLSSRVGGRRHRPAPERTSAARSYLQGRAGKDREAGRLLSRGPSGHSQPGLFPVSHALHGSFEWAHLGAEGHPVCTGQSIRSAHRQHRSARDAAVGGQQEGDVSEEVGESRCRQGLALSYRRADHRFRRWPQRSDSVIASTRSWINSCTPPGSC